MRRNLTVRKKELLFRAIPTMTFQDAYLDIYSDILSGISFDSLSDTLSNILTFYLTFYLAYILTFQLAFYLAFYLTFYLPFYLAFYLAQKVRRGPQRFSSHKSRPRPTETVALQKSGKTHGDQELADAIQRGGR